MHDTQSRIKTGPCFFNFLQTPHQPAKGNAALRLILRREEHVLLAYTRRMIGGNRKIAGEGAAFANNTTNGYKPLV